MTRFYALILVFLTLTCCRRPDLNISGEFTLWLTEEIRLEKSSATDISLVDRSGRRIADASVLSMSHDAHVEKKGA